MQPEIKYGLPPVNRQERLKIQQHASTTSNNDTLQTAGPAEKQQDFLSPADSALPGEATGMHEFQMRGHRTGWKPSPTQWQLILVLGDTTLFLTLLVWKVKPPAHIILHMPGSIPVQWSSHFMLDFLTFASWVLAVNITQAQQLQRAAGPLKSPLSALFALGLTLMFFPALLYLFIGHEAISYIQALLFFLLLATPAFSLWRLSLAKVINLPRFRHQAVIMGSNDAGKDIAQEILSARHSNIHVLGYINESMHEQKQHNELPTFGGSSALHNLAHNGSIDMIIVAVDFKPNPELFREAFAGAQRGISVVPATALYESTSGKIALDHIADQWSTVFPRRHPVLLLYLCWQKALDLAFGGCGLLLLGILLLFLAPLIYLDSPGPIFFSQERAGYRGKTFRILKLRTMGADTESARGGAWVSRGDARVTRVGRILRALHLDELPQVLNIVRGDMSLIGPRPERPNYVVDLSNTNVFYAYRLSVKPGLTGWAQVKYGYGRSEQDELVKLQYDLYYIKHQSISLDVCILLKTIGEVVLCHGV